MFQFSLTKTAVIFGLCAFTAMFANTANAQSGSRGSGSRAAAPSFSPAQSYAPASTYQAPTSTYRAPTSTYQAPSAATQNNIQPAVATSSCTNCQRGVSPSFVTSTPVFQPAPVHQSAPVCQAAPIFQSAPVYNFRPAPVYQPVRSCGCGGF